MNNSNLASIKLRLFFICIAFILYVPSALSNVPLLDLPPTRISPVDILEATNDQDFGYAIAIDNNIMVIGARNDDENGGFAGAAFIYYQNQNGEWDFIKKIVGSDTDPNDEFGHAVTINNNVIVVGAPGSHSNSEDPVGAVYIFHRDLGGDDNWGEFDKLIGEVDDLEDNKSEAFGFSIALEGTTLVVGAPEDHYTDVDNAGSVYIFSYNGNAWGQPVKRILNSTTDDFFGWSVAVSGSRVAVGAIRAGGVADGRAYLLDGTNNWEFEKTLRGEGGLNGDEFGYAVALDNDILVVAAPNKSSFFFNGFVFIFYQNTFDLNDNVNTEWGFEESLQAFDQGPIADFANALELKNNILVVGSPKEDSDAGVVSIYKKDNGGADLWGKEGEILIADDFKNNESSPSDQFGFAVAISDNVIAIGSPNNDADPLDGITEEGSVYLYSIKTDLFSDGFES